MWDAILRHVQADGVTMFGDCSRCGRALKHRTCTPCEALTRETTPADVHGLVGDAKDVVDSAWESITLNPGLASAIRRVAGQLATIEGNT